MWEWCKKTPALMQPKTISSVNKKTFMTQDQIQAIQLAEIDGQSDALESMFNRFPDSGVNYWAVVDFNQSSSVERLFIFDLNSRSVRKFLVAHGHNSGNEFATNFSNEIGSNCSSLGIYRTLDVYIGKHGNSLRIEGLDATNSNADARHVVIHKADYVVPNYKGTGRAGRSDGCFAVNPDDIEEVIECLRDGSYLNAWHS
jgi:hypothetical protein